MCCLEGRRVGFQGTSDGSNHDEHIIKSWSSLIMAMTSGCDTSGVNKFYNLPIGDSCNPPHTLAIESFASDGSSNWKILTRCLQIYPRCAYTQLQLDDFVVGLCTMYVMYGFYAERTNARHPSINAKLHFQVE